MLKVADNFELYAHYPHITYMCTTSIDFNGFVLDHKFLPCAQNTSCTNNFFRFFNWL